MRQKGIKYVRIALATVCAGIICIVAIPRKDLIEVDFASPQYGTIEETVPANGKVKPVVEVKISPDVSGEIIGLYCQEGDAVQKGDLLITIKQDLYISAVNRAEASLNSTKAQYVQQQAQLSQVELKYGRNRRLYEDSVISRADYEASLAEYNIEKARLDAIGFAVKSDEATLQEMREQLDKTLIFSPISGIVSKVMIEEGERVVGTSQMAGTEMLRVADFENIEVIADVNENDILKVHLRDSALLEIDAYPDLKFKGVVTNIANSSTAVFAEQVTNFEVKIGIIAESYSNLLKDNGIPFRPGMSASATIFTGKRENVLTVPLQSVVYRDNREAVWVADKDNVVTLRAVRTGIQDFGCIEILDGLSEDDRIITGPYSAINRDLSEGDRVTER
ncbi:MAG: efflux RND transporter periplasmic adaptor subunit [Bacteroidales bacterium]|nr:efflux RND transporter periplasmic adaptor subunit [Bacteroidales bacterium]